MEDSRRLSGQVGADQLVVEEDRVADEPRAMDRDDELRVRAHEEPGRPPVGGADDLRRELGELSDRPRIAAEVAVVVEDLHQRLWLPMAVLAGDRQRAVPADRRGQTL